MRHDDIGRIAEAIAADAPPRFAMAGLSMGGYIALEVCRQFGDRVERLALIDTSARPDTVEQTHRRENLMALCRQGQFEQVADALYPFLVHPDRLNDRELKNQVVNMARRMGPDVFIRQQQAIIGRIDQVPHLSRITCPTVVVCGEQDQITPIECAREMAGKIGDAQLAVVARCGHMSTMEKPEAVSGILHDWLSRA